MYKIEEILWRTLNGPSEKVVIWNGDKVETDNLGRHDSQRRLC